MRAIGLMSGTSLDGMDAALVETDGVRLHGLGPALTLPFDARTRAALQEAVQAALAWQFAGPAPASFAPAARALGAAAQQAVQAVLDAAGLKPAQLDVIGFHGQTVLHRPPLDGKTGQTCQIGDARALARDFGVQVVHDFRKADMAAGGHGAPLAPAYHQVLAADLPKPLMVLNIGGVANLTWLGPGGAMLAFDTGPGNGPLDAWVRRHGAGDMDAGGALAARGRVDVQALEALLNAPYFVQEPPKSADRWDFDAAPVQHLGLEDGAATLSAWCVEAVVRALRFLPAPPRQILVAGGGRHNPFLMRRLASRTGMPVKAAESAGWRGDALEAEAFACLAVRRLKQLPASWPSTTGCRAPVCGGVIAAPS